MPGINARPLDADVLHRLAFITPNEEEMDAILAALPEGLRPAPGAAPLSPEEKCARVHAYVRERNGAQSNITIILKLGSRGALVSYVSKDTGSAVDTRIPPVVPTRIQNVCGAGDSMVAAAIWDMLENGAPVEHAVHIGARAAALSLQSVTPVSENICDISGTCSH